MPRTTTTAAATGAVGLALALLPSVPAAAAEPLPAALDYSVVTCPAARTPAAPLPDRGAAPQPLAVDCVAAYGITQGRADGTFGPAAPVRRDQMALFLVRLGEYLGVPFRYEPATSLTDYGTLRPEVRTAVSALVSAGVTGGTADGSFAPDRLVTRGQMVAFLARLQRFAQTDPTGFASGAPGAVPDYFDDDSGRFYAADADQLADGGVAQGTGGGRLDGEQPVSRGQMAVFLSRVLEWNHRVVDVAERDGRLKPLFPADNEQASWVTERALREPFVTSGTTPDTGTVDLTWTGLPAEPLRVELFDARLLGVGDTGPGGNVVFTPTATATADRGDPAATLQVGGVDQGTATTVTPVAGRLTVQLAPDGSDGPVVAVVHGLDTGTDLTVTDGGFVNPQVRLALSRVVPFTAGGVTDDVGAQTFRVVDVDPVRDALVVQTSLGGPVARVFYAAGDTYATSACSGASTQERFEDERQAEVTPGGSGGSVLSATYRGTAGPSTWGVLCLAP